MKKKNKPPRPRPPAPPRPVTSILNIDDKIEAGRAEVWVNMTEDILCRMEDLGLSVLDVAAALGYSVKQIRTLLYYEYGEPLSTPISILVDVMTHVGLQCQPLIIISEGD